MTNFCTNCGHEIRKEDNFCTNCGTKIDRTDINQNNNIHKTVLEIIEKKKAEEKAIKEQEKTKIAKEKEMRNRKKEYAKPAHGGYCSLNCRHCYEEFLDSGGGIVGDFDSDGYVEYYCHLGHSIVYGRYCEDYE